MEKTIGFIGSGNMATAMIGGILNAGLVDASRIICSNKTEEKLKKINADYHIKTTLDNSEVAKKSDVLVLAVKPFAYKEVIEEIKDKITDNKVIISIAAGVKIDTVKKHFQKDIKVVRAMPNTPALVLEGMTALSPCPRVEKEELNLICNIFNSFGKCEVVPEHLMDAVTAVSGSSPAFIFMVIEAMADAAVREGIPRDKAYVFAAQTVLGSAKMVLETKKHPGELKDMVTSPSGTTIEGLATLEKCGLRNSFIKAIHKTTERSKDLSK